MAEATTTETPVVLPQEATKDFAKFLVGETRSLSRDSVIKAAREKLATEGADSALGVIAGRIIPFSENDVEKTIVENLGSIDEKTGKKGIPQSDEERTRYNETAAITEAIRAFLENPSSDPPKKLVDKAAYYLFQMPQFRDLLVNAQGQLDTDIVNRLVPNILRQPKVLEAMRRMYCERLDPTRRLQSEKRVRELRAEVADLEARMGEDIDQKISQLTTEISKLETAVFTNPTYSDYERIIQEIENSEEQIRINQQILNNPSGYRNTNIDLNQVRQDLLTLNRDLQQKKGELAQMRRDSKNQQFFNNLDQLSAKQLELQQLLQQRQNINPQERQRLQQELAAKKAELAEAESIFLADQIKFAGEIQAIVPEAIKEYIDDSLEKFRKFYGEAKAEEEKKQQEQKTKEEQEKAEREKVAKDKILSRIGKRKKMIKGNEVYVVDKKSAETLLFQLLSPGGAERLFDATTGELRANTTHLKNTFGLTEEEANLIVKRLGDPTFRRELGAEVSHVAFSDYLLAGGRLSKNLSITLTSSDYGRDLIEKGMAMLDSRRQEVEKLVGRDVMEKFDELRTQHKSIDWLSKHWYIPGALIALLVLLGIKGIKG